MEDRKLPWWRRALNLALDGIRSGFGLFSKPHKEDADHAPEIAAVPDGPAAEEARANLHSAAVELVKESPVAEQPAQVAEIFVEPVSEVAAEEVAIVEAVAERAADSDVEAAAEPPELVSQRVDEAIEEPVAELAVEPVDVPVAEPVAGNVRDEDRAQSSPEKSAPVVEAAPHTKIADSAADEEPGRLRVELPDSISELSENLKAEEEVEPEASVTPAPAVVAEAIAVAAPPAFSEVLEAAIVSSPEVEFQKDVALDAELNEAEPEQKIESESEPEPEVEIIEDSIDEVVIEESGLETAPIEHEEEIAIDLEAPEETSVEPEVSTTLEPVVAAPVVETPEVEEIAVAEPVLAEPAVSEPDETDPLTLEEAEAAVEVVDKPALELEAPPEGTTEDEPEHEVFPETAVEAAEEIAEPAAEPEIEPPPEAADDEAPAPVEDSIPEEPVSSVELSEPVPAEVAEETPGQTESTEIEIPLEEGPPAAEPVPQDEGLEVRAAEQDAEQVAEESPEPADIPMELNETIPDQHDVPTEAEESAPAAEASAEPVASVEIAEAVETSESVEPAEPTTAAAIVAAEAAAEVADEAGPTAAATPAAPAKPFIKLESRDNESDLSPFSVVVSQVYDGPLDLLLDLIRKQDIDIYDIPIARITAQFLAYVNQLKATDVDVAGEFIYIASLLIHIKSKMLLPRAPSGGDDAAEDPRRELVERLLEHERFKNAAQMLQQKQMLEAATWTNPGLREFQDDTSAEPEIAADTVDLVRIFRDILERARNRPVINVEEDSVTVGQMIQFLARRLTMEDKPVALRRLLSQTRSERALIAMFLALLELVRLQAILLRQDKLFSEIFIKKHVGFETVMNEGAASARDDWR